MPDAIQLEFPEADRRALFAQMERARKELGRTLGQSVRFAAWSVARTLGTSTRVASKVREAFEVRGRRVDKTGWTGRRKFLISAYRNGKPRPIERYGESLSDPKVKRARRVRNYGLAKASWMWGVKALGAGAAFGGTSGDAREKAQRRMDVAKQLKGDDPFVRLTNKLSYAQEALKGGPRSVDTALGRAASYMAHIIDGNIRKKMGAK